MQRNWKPSKQQLAAAAGRKVADVIAPNLKVLFCGINPGFYSGAVGHHFARPGNRFWPALHLSGFTNRLLSPTEERQLLERGLGITNIVDYATAGENDLSSGELTRGARALSRKLRRYGPRFVAFVGIGAYRIAFQKPGASLGRQEELLGETAVWVLPNPSGLNAHYQLPSLVKLFEELRIAAMGRCRNEQE